MHTSVWALASFPTIGRRIPAASSRWDTVRLVQASHTRTNVPTTERGVALRPGTQPSRRRVWCWDPHAGRAAQVTHTLHQPMTLLGRWAVQRYQIERGDAVIPCRCRLAQHTAPVEGLTHGSRQLRGAEVSANRSSISHTLTYYHEGCTRHCSRTCS